MCGEYRDWTICLSEGWDWMRPGAALGTTIAQAVQAYRRHLTVINLKKATGIKLRKV